MTPIVWRSRLLRPHRHRFGHHGDGTIVHRPTWVYNAHLMSIGSDVLVLSGASLSVEGTPDRAGPVLSIGDRVGIRPAVTISATEKVTIEDDVIIGSFSSIVDSDHTFDLGRPNVMHN